MKRRRLLLQLLKKLFSATKSETYILISSWLTGFFIIFLLNSILGIYSVFGSSDEILDNYKAINLARDAQVALYEQTLAWDTVLLSGSSKGEFRKNFHEFSRKAESVQNTLFNLKLQVGEDRLIQADIEKLLSLHKEMTLEFTYHITEMEQRNFKNAWDKKLITSGMKNELINSLNDITSGIEKSGKERSGIISFRYLVIAAVCSLLFITLVLIYGRRTGRLLLRTNNILEEMVIQRTREYVEANISLKNEIDGHMITAQKLRDSNAAIEEKNLLLSVSEKKYRQIVEGTSDIIFTLDDRWFFKTANDSIRTQLKISPGAAAKLRLTDLICDELTEATILRKIYTEKLEECRRENRPLEFNAYLKTPNLIEPVEFRINLEFIEIEGKSEVIGKAARLSDDRFSGAFISEKCEYSIRNMLFEADDISHRITNNLQKYLGKMELNMIRIGLREMLVNSIEHGNLNISFDEKTEAILNDRYFEFINEKQTSPDCINKRVRIEYFISPARAIFKISDQGRGFNHKKFMAELNDETADITLNHGRGIAMALSIFDEVRYNTRGNQVLLVKHISHATGKEADATYDFQDEAVHAEAG